MKNLMQSPVKFRRLAILVLAMLMLLTAASVSAGSEEPFIQKPDRGSGDLTEMRSFATLKAGGAMLEFQEIRMDDGRIVGIGIAQTVRGGHSGIESVRELKGADALEVYNALSEPGTRLPRELVKMYGKAELGMQGWALPLDLPLTDGGNPQEIACMVGAESWNAFKGDILDHDYPFVFLSEKDGPGTQPNHWFDDNGTADGTIRSQLQGGVNNMTHFYGKVSYCYEDLYEPIGFHGRYVTFSLRVSDLFPTWQQLPSTQLLDPGDSASYHFTPAPGSSAEFDFRMNITAAKTSDMFHIGATWANPGGTLTFGD